jgi:hypothetical protein
MMLPAQYGAVIASNSVRMASSLFFGITLGPNDALCSGNGGVQAGFFE